MAIYKFKVSFEDYDVVREIDIRSNQTFEDFHLAIHQSIGYKPEVPSSFYISNDQWHKGHEITIHPNEKRTSGKIALMSNSKLHNFIEDPHQKFYYISNFDRPFDFHVELVRILIEPDPKLSYPAIIKMYGEAPRQFSSAPVVIPKTEAPLGLAALIADEPEEDESPGFSLAELGTSEGLDEDDHHSLEGKTSLLSSDGETESDDALGDGDVEPAEDDEFGGFGMDEDHHHGKEDY